MAGSVNKVILVGRLGRDPELKYTPGGSEVASFSMATSRYYTSNEEQKEETTWHNIQCWGRLATIVTEHLNKGRLVYVQGRINISKWEDDDGNRREMHRIVADSVQFLDRASGERSELEPEAAAADSEEEEQFEMA